MWGGDISGSEGVNEDKACSVLLQENKGLAAQLRSSPQAGGDLSLDRQRLML